MGDAAAIVRALEGSDRGRRFIAERIRPYQQEFGWHAVWSHEFIFPSFLELMEPIVGLVKDQLAQDYDYPSSKAKLAAGPNNPVGVVWIDLDKEHYGLHGTPEPERVGVTQSHGCVRLTNWDVMRLASFVQTGTPIIFEP